MNVGGPAMLILALLKSDKRELLDQKLVYGGVAKGEREVPLHGVEKKVSYNRSLGREISIRDLFCLLGQIRELYRFKPEILVSHTFKAGLINRVSVLFVLNHKPKVVHNYHGHLLHGYMGSFRRAIYIQIEKILARFSDAIIVDGPGVKAELMQAGIGMEYKYSIILPGVTPPIHQYTSKQPLEPIFGFIGRLEDIKRPEIFLDVLEALYKLNWNGSAKIYGEGSLLPVLKNRIEKNKIRVELSPFVEDIYVALNEIDILVVTSANEGTPLTIMEAAYAGVPTVSFNVGSISSILINGVTGVLVPDEPEALIEACFGLVKNPESLIQLSNNAKVYAASNFNIERYVDDHIKLYNSLSQ
jgi:glycosyltransferase involved in cell wall biosynthesis